MDVSGSISDSDYDNAKQAVLNFIKATDESISTYAGNHFSSSADEISATPQMQAAALKAWDVPRSDSGGTCMACGLDAALSYLSSVPSDTAKVIVLVTDGKPEDKDDTIASVTKIKGQKVILVTVGVGSGIDTDFLKQQATNPSLYFAY